MNNNIDLNAGQAAPSNEVLKLTALSYLKEALQKQEYERCKDLVDDAKHFGAGQNEISAAIASYKQVDQPAANSEANKGKNRLRSLKE